MRTMEGTLRVKTMKKRAAACFVPALALMAVISGTGFFDSVSSLPAASKTLACPQASETRPAVYFGKIRESLLRQKDFGDPDTAHRNLERILERIKNEVRPQAGLDKSSALMALNSIADILSGEENFEYKKNSLLIVELNKDSQEVRYLDCDDYSSLYLAAAEHIGLAMKPVYFPDHVFLKCELDDGSSFFWEATMAEESSIRYYSRWSGVSFEGGFPIILDEKQLEAIQLSDLGVAWFLEENYQRAAEYFQRSLEANSEFGTAYNNLGASLARQGKLGDAMDCYQTAIDKNPNNSTAFLNTGVAFYRMGEFKKSVECFDKSLEINPGSSKANLYKYRVLVADGKPGKAVRWLNQLRKARAQAQFLLRFP